MRPNVVVTHAPFFDEYAGLVAISEPFQVEAFLSEALAAPFAPTTAKAPATPLQLADLCARIGVAPDRTETLLAAAEADFAEVRGALERELLTKADAAISKGGALHG